MTISLLTTLSTAPTVRGTTFIQGKSENIDTTASPLPLTLATSSTVAKLSTYQFLIADTLD